LALAGDLAGIGTGDVCSELLPDKYPVEIPNPVSPPVGVRPIGLELPDDEFDLPPGIRVDVGKLLILGLTDGATG